ncbi:MAG TPA: hypothetical protein VE135_17345 [Pyrinomonadaceae bacterium]|nr:hypothetical protein [Pyrinomonadaceae bacterium]
MSKEKLKSRMQAGTSVMVILHSPREKIWGMLDEISLAGVFLRGIDLNSFDEWLRAVAHDEPFIGVGDLFFPMWRVERISRDESTGGIPSLYEQAEQRTGRRVSELLEDDSPPA